MLDLSIQKNGYKPSNTIVSKELEYVLQQIEILFSTSCGDLLGDTSYGTNYEYYLYELKLDADVLASHVLQDLNSIDLMGWQPSVEVFLSQGTERDIALIEINLRKNSEAHKQYYKIY